MTYIRRGLINGNYFLHHRIVGRARASFRQSFRFGNMRDRGARLAGYLTPPSDVTQEEEETASERVVVIPCDSNRFGYFSNI